MTRYCWISKELGFSGSWDEDTHKVFFDEGIKSYAEANGWRLIKYETICGEDFEFTENMILNQKPK